MSTSAQLFIDTAPKLGPDTRRFTIDCKWSRTYLLWTPGNDLELTERQLVNVVLLRHEEECGRCRLERLWQKHGDLELKALTDRAWNRLQQDYVRDHLAGLRN